MKKAKKVSPTTILEAIVEVRFTSDISGGSLAVNLSKALDDWLPKLEELPAANIPTVIRDQGGSPFKFQPTHRLSGDNYNVSVSNSILSIGFVRTEDKDYPGWEELSKNVKRVIEELKKQVKPEVYDRVGVRYINTFRNSIDFINGLEAQIKHPFSKEKVKLEDASTLGFFIKEASLNCKVQISTGAVLSTPDSNRNAAIIDLDCFGDGPITQEDVLSVVGQCHTLAEDTYFELLKREYADSIFEEIVE